MPAGSISGAPKPKTVEIIKEAEMARHSGGFRHAFEKMDMPTYVIWGEEDRVLDVSAVAAFKALIPQAKVHIFPEIGHLPMIENPEESAGVFQQFISTI